MRRTKSKTHFDVLKLAEKHFDQMSEKAVAYLTDSVPYESQFPASRCAMGQNVYMYKRSTSSGGESMNNANHAVRHATAVDCINATILLLKLESERFTKQQTAAWTHDGYFTPRGQKMFDEIAATSTADYRVSIENDEDFHIGKVKLPINNKSPERTVKIPKVNVNNLLFGTCSCGVPQVDSVPCIHMMAVAKSGRVNGLAVEDLMPWWWTTRQWRLQLPKELVVMSTVSMSGLKENFEPDMKLKYCPDWTAGRKAGRPKKGSRIPSAVEIGGKKRNKKRPYCVWCNKYNHTSDKCFNHPRKKDKDDEE